MNEYCDTYAIKMSGDGVNEVRGSDGAVGCHHGETVDDGFANVERGEGVAVIRNHLLLLRRHGDGAVGWASGHAAIVW